MLHSFGDLDYHVDQAKDKDRGEVMVDRITEMFYEESIDHVYAYGEPKHTLLVLAVRNPPQRVVTVPPAERSQEPREVGRGIPVAL